MATVRAKRRRAIAQNVSFETLKDGQFTLSTQLTILYYITLVCGSNEVKGALKPFHFISVLRKGQQVDHVKNDLTNLLTRERSLVADLKEALAKEKSRITELGATLEKERVQVMSLK